VVPVFSAAPAQELDQPGAKLRVLAPWKPATEMGFAHAAVEWVLGSITDEATVAGALSGVTEIYHLAGFVSRSRADARRLHQIHVDARAFLCTLAKHQNIRRMVLASTSGTIAVTEDGTTCPDEESPRPVEIIARWPYYISKLYQEHAALALFEDGPELCVLHPSLLLGPGDARLSSTRDVADFWVGGSHSPARRPSSPTCEIVARAFCVGDGARHAGLSLSFGLGQLVICRFLQPDLSKVMHPSCVPRKLLRGGPSARGRSMSGSSRPSSSHRALRWARISGYSMTQGSFRARLFPLGIPLTHSSIRSSIFAPTRRSFWMAPLPGK